MRRRIDCWLGCPASTNQAAILAAGLVLTLLSWGCTQGTSGPTEPVWKHPAQLEEVSRIGVETGDPEQMLGSVSSVWGTLTEAYVVDVRQPGVHVYTSSGEYLRQIGRRGQGPGEYLRPFAVAVGPAGKIFVLEAPGVGLVHVYRPNGQYSHRWSYPSSFTGSSPFLVDGSGDIYTATGRWETRPTENRGLKSGFTRISAGGTVHNSVFLESALSRPDDGWALFGSRDSIIGRVPFAPARNWAVGPYGLTVSGDSSTNEVSIASPDALEPTVVTLGGDPVTIDPGEARYSRAHTTASIRELAPNWRWRGRDVPEVKPAHIGLFVSADSSVWILREGPGAPVPDCTIEGPDRERVTCWQSPLYADVFKPNGVYLGEISIPREVFLSVSFIGSDFLLARVEDAAGTVQVVRYAIVVSQ